MIRDRLVAKDFVDEEDLETRVVDDARLKMVMPWLRCLPPFLDFSPSFINFFSNTFQN